MKLYIRFGSLFDFQMLYNNSEYLQEVLSKIKPNAYLITGESGEIRRLLSSRSINFEISE